MLTQFIAKNTLRNLNKINVSGLPPHKCIKVLNKGQPFIHLRYFNGLCKDSSIDNIKIATNNENKFTPKKMLD